MTYAIVRLGGKQYRVREGERLLVDRLAVAESKTFHPEVLLVGGDGKAELAPKGVEVTAKVVGHVLGDKVRIGKYKPKKGYKRHNGFRARLSQVEIQAIARKAAARPKVAEEKPKAKPAAKAEAKSAAAKPEAAAKPKAATKAKKAE